MKWIVTVLVCVSVAIGALTALATQSAIEWQDRKSVIDSFDQETAPTFAALEHVLIENGATHIAAALEQYLAGPFYAVPDWRTWQARHRELVTKYGEGSLEVKAFAFGLEVLAKGRE